MMWDVAKYAMALINKHIEAEGGPDKIDRGLGRAWTRPEIV